MILLSDTELKGCKIAFKWNVFVLCVLGYLAHRAAVGEARFGESHDFTW